MFLYWIRISILNVPCFLFIKNVRRVVPLSSFCKRKDHRVCRPHAHLHLPGSLLLFVLCLWTRCMGWVRGGERLWTAAWGRLCDSCWSMKWATCSAPCFIWNKSPFRFRVFLPAGPSQAKLCHGHREDGLPAQQSRWFLGSFAGSEVFFEVENLMWK